MMYETRSSLFALLCVLSSLVGIAGALPLAGPIPWSPKIVQRHIELSLNKVKRSMAQAINQNFPDPCIYYVGNTWYAFGTTNGDANIPMAKSTDFNTWEIISGDALPTVPGWVDQSAPNTWAPDIQQVDDGSFVLYFTASSASEPTKHCVGAATSSSITGPYSGLANPMACPLDQGGAIDPSSFVDSGGQRYVLYKVDGNSEGHGGDCGNDVDPTVSTPIMLQAVLGDGTSLQGGATQIFDNNGLSDQGIVEAPSLVKAPDNIYYLFFSSGCYSDTNYNVNYATSNSLTGPYTRASSPLFVTGTDGLTSPGGADIWNDGVHMVFHAGPADDRTMYIAQVSTNGNTVSA